MKVILLAGGYGTRLSEYTDLVPKPMVRIGDKPILWHIMKNYAHFGHKEFYVALGYKAEVIKEYFLNYSSLNSDFSVDLSTGKVSNIKKNVIDWKVNLIDTGKDSMTGGRVKRLQKHIGNETFMLTYGDGLANIDIDKLLNFHKDHGKLITMSAVRPTARFGEIFTSGDKVTSFLEKPQLQDGWINGGFFVIEPEFFDYIEEDSTMLEREPLEKAVSKGELMVFRHEGFWQCMDSKRDRELLEKLSGKDAPWLVE